MMLAGFIGSFWFYAIGILVVVGLGVALYFLRQNDDDDE